MYCYPLATWFHFQITASILSEIMVAEKTFNPIDNFHFKPPFCSVSVFKYLHNANVTTALMDIPFCSAAFFTRLCNSSVSLIVVCILLPLFHFDSEMISVLKRFSCERQLRGLSTVFQKVAFNSTFILKKFDPAHL